MNENLSWVSLKLVVFTVFTIVVTVWLASIIGNLRLFSQPYQIRAEFSDATGLLGGDVVKAAGVTVGRVDGIAIDDGIAVVTMTIDEGIELPRDLSAEIRFRNLIGQRMVTLVEGEGASGDELIEPGDVITLERTEAAFDLSSLFNGLRPLIRSTSPHDINVVTEELVAALEGRSGDVESLLTNVADISDVLASRDQELSRLLDGLNTVTSDLAARDRQLRSTLRDLNRFVTEFAAGRHELAAALESLDEAASRLQPLLDRNDENIDAELRDLAILLDAVSDKRADLRAAVRSLPEVLLAVERALSYGEWSMIHLIDVCKDDLTLTEPSSPQPDPPGNKDCGGRGTP